MAKITLDFVSCDLGDKIAKALKNPEKTSSKELAVLLADRRAAINATVTTDSALVRGNHSGFTASIATKVAIGPISRKVRETNDKGEIITIQQPTGLLVKENKGVSILPEVKAVSVAVTAMQEAIAKVKKAKDEKSKVKKAKDEKAKPAVKVDNGNKDKAKVQAQAQ